MDCKLNGLFSNYVLALMLLVILWRLVFPAAIDTSCDLERTKRLTNLLRYEAKELLGEYRNNRSISRSVPDDVPVSTISGISISEKMQDIYIKNELFNWHILKVDEYQKKLWGNLKPAAEPLVNGVKFRLGYLLDKIRAILLYIEPKRPLPTMPAPPQLSHNHDYAKKEYVLRVISILKDWLTEVLLVLDEAREVCDKQTAETFKEPLLRSLRKLPH